MMPRANGSRPVARKSPALDDYMDKAASRSVEDAAAMASYIADMASELSNLASGDRLQMVAYFLNLARVEAEMQARELGGVAIRRGEG
jgi:hypothetical protein